MITTPTYTIKLLSEDREIKFRPFLVKEEKLLLMAVESKDTNEIIKTVFDVLNNCIMTDIDVEKLPYFEVDYLFTTLRAKSIKENIELEFICNNMIDDNKCKALFPVTLDLAKATIDRNEDISNKIELSDTSGVVMKYPTYDIMKRAVSIVGDMNKKFHVIESCIDYIYNKDKIFSSKDIGKNDIIGFLENLTQNQFQKIEFWVDSLPSFSIKTEGDCPKCGYHHKIKYDDFNAFFL